jgi:DNA-binding HxlR family transcriptional regulator
VWELREEQLGFRALQERCEGMSSSVLRDRLAELVGAGLIEANDDRR